MIFIELGVSTTVNSLAVTNCHNTINKIFFCNCYFMSYEIWSCQPLPHYLPEKLNVIVNLQFTTSKKDCPEY